MGVLSEGVGQADGHVKGGEVHLLHVGGDGGGLADVHGLLHLDHVDLGVLLAEAALHGLALGPGLEHLPVLVLTSGGGGHQKGKDH